MREPAVYIITNKRNGTLYTGVTSNLSRRIFEHRTKAKTGFASIYDCVLLVWYEHHDRMDDAIAREK
jgi:putative endonuclease